MSKSEGNGFTPEELITGDHKLLEQGYSPMTVRFFMLQCQYSSTLDFSNDALRAAEKGYNRLMEGFETLKGLTPATPSTVDVATIRQACYDAMNDDFNTPILIARLFEAVKLINLIKAGTEKAAQADLDTLEKLMSDFAFDVLGFRLEGASAQSSDEKTPALIELAIEIRKAAKMGRDFATADQIRDELARIGITLKDGADGTSFTID